MTKDPEHSPPAQAADTAEEQVVPLEAEVPADGDSAIVVNTISLAMSMNQSD
ncbi:hypothetical protein FALCPG4_005488 [Fusarium falciforme]